MARLKIPLRYRVLQHTGDVLLRAELGLVLKTSRAKWVQATFRVDSGTEMSTMPAAEAKRLHLPMPRQAIPNLTMCGQDVRAGFIRSKIPGLDATEYVFPCYFLGDPNAPINPSWLSTSAAHLLGLSGVINQLDISITGDPGPNAPYGYLIVEKK